VMAAMRRADPFPAPPPSLIGSEGVSRIRFGIYLGSGAFGAGDVRRCRAREPGGGSGHRLGCSSGAELGCRSGPESRPCSDRDPRGTLRQIALRRTRSGRVEWPRVPQGAFKPPLRRSVREQRG
jgi:hypothetical protein